LTTLMPKAPWRYHCAGNSGSVGKGSAVAAIWDKSATTVSLPSAPKRIAAPASPPEKPEEPVPANEPVPALDAAAVPPLSAGPPKSDPKNDSEFGAVPTSAITALGLSASTAIVTVSSSDIVPVRISLKDTVCALPEDVVWLSKTLTNFWLGRAAGEPR